MTDRNSGDKGRKPRAFSIDEPAAGPKPKQAAQSGKPRAPAAIPVSASVIMTQDDPFLPQAQDVDALTPPPAEPRRRRLTAGKIIFASLGFLAALALGLWVDAMIRDLLIRLPWLGWVALAATAIGLLALAIVVIRELAGLRRLEIVAGLRAEISATGGTLSARQARSLAARVAGLLATSPLTARGRKNLEALDTEIVDGPHYLAFAERELMTPLDRQARQLTLNAARRVSVVTAVSPRALVDVAYVGFEAVRLIRALAELYGGRPGAIGMIRLFRDVIAHLAVTGAVAAGDALIQQVVGHGLAARLSARLGEGVINGLMTARIGISAMDLCRPMPFSALKRPGIGDFITEIARFNGAPKPDRPGEKLE